LNRRRTRATAGQGALIRGDEPFPPRRCSSLPAGQRELADGAAGFQAGVGLAEVGGIDGRERFRGGW